MILSGLEVHVLSLLYASCVSCFLEERSIVMCDVRVYLYDWLCLFGCKLISDVTTHPIFAKFLCKLPMVVLRRFLAVAALRYVMFFRFYG